MAVNCGGRSLGKCVCMWDRGVQCSAVEREGVKGLTMGKNCQAQTMNSQFAREGGNQPVGRSVVGEEKAIVRRWRLESRWFRSQRREGLSWVSIDVKVWLVDSESRAQARFHPRHRILHVDV